MAAYATSVVAQKTTARLGGTARHVRQAERRWPSSPAIEFRDALQRRASQALRVARNGLFPLALQAGHPPIEGGDELTQVVHEGLV